MTMKSLVEQRRANKPPEFTIIPHLGNYPAVKEPTHWTVQRRRVFWLNDDWGTKPIADPRVDGVKFSETEARAECALLNGEKP